MGIIIALLVILVAGSALLAGVGALPILLLVPVLGGLAYLGFRLASHLFSGTRT
jgi:hypothetical protein